MMIDWRAIERVIGPPPGVRDPSVPHEGLRKEYVFEPCRRGLHGDCPGQAGHGRNIQLRCTCEVCAHGPFVPGRGE